MSVVSRKVRLEHWHPQLVKEEAAFVFSTDRQEALRTRVARMLTWVNMMDLDLIVWKMKWLCDCF